MNTITDMLPLLVDPLLAGLAIALMCSVLSVLVVVKKLGFIGQGISHSAFGGVGVAAMLAAVGWISAGGVAEFLIILGFCTAAALGMAFTGKKREVSVDAAIGLFLVASMAAGGLLVHGAQRVAPGFGRSADVRSWESILFGSLIVTGRTDVYLAGAAAATVIGAAWWYRRRLVFWAFDEETASAFGMQTAWVKALMMVLLAIAVVTSMKLAGVVLATALLVLPGATALKLTDRLVACLGIAAVVGVGGILLGLFASVMLDWQPGPCMVLVMTVAFAIATGWNKVAAARS